MNIFNNNKAEIEPTDVIAMGITLTLIGGLIMGAITLFYDFNTSTWNTGSRLLWDSLPIIIIVVIILPYLEKKRKS